MMRKMVVCIIRMLRRDIIHSYKSEKPQQSASATLPKRVNLAYRANINTGEDQQLQSSLTHTPAVLVDPTNQSTARWLA